MKLSAKLNHRTNHDFKVVAWLLIASLLAPAPVWASATDALRVGQKEGLEELEELAEALDPALGDLEENLDKEPIASSGQEEAQTAFAAPYFLHGRPATLIAEQLKWFYRLVDGKVAIAVKNQTKGHQTNLVTRLDVLKLEVNSKDQITVTATGEVPQAVLQSAAETIAAFLKTPEIGLTAETVEQYTAQYTTALRPTPQQDAVQMARMLVDDAVAGTRRAFGKVWQTYQNEGSASGAEEVPLESVVQAWKGVKLDYAGDILERKAFLFTEPEHFKYIPLVLMAHAPIIVIAPTVEMTNAVHDLIQATHPELREGWRYKVWMGDKEKLEKRARYEFRNSDYRVKIFGKDLDVEQLIRSLGYYFVGSADAAIEALSKTEAHLRFV